jgi:hypothetical protein
MNWICPGESPQRVAGIKDSRDSRRIEIQGGGILPAIVRIASIYIYEN